MGRRQLDMAEKVVGVLIEQVGARCFVAALNNACSHGGALLNAPGVYLDGDDFRLQEWHKGIDRLSELAKWLEGDDDQMPAFVKADIDVESRGTKPRLSDRIGKRTLDQMMVGDRTQHPIASVEHLVFELTGEKIQFLREKNDRKSTVLLRCGLAMFMNEVINAMNDDHEFDDVVFAIAKCVAESGVTVNWHQHEFITNAQWNRVERVKVENTDTDEFPPERSGWPVEIREFEDFLKQELGTHFSVIAIHENLELSDEEEQDYEISNGLKFPFPKQQLKRALKLFVENRRNIGYLVDTFSDHYGIQLRPEANRQRVVAGPGRTAIHPRTARREAEKALD